MTPRAFDQRTDDRHTRCKHADGEAARAAAADARFDVRVIHHGDCVEVMAGMEPASVDAICTDPPYGIGFMGKAWDDAGRLASVPPSAVRLAESGRDPYPKTGKGPAAVAFDGHAYQHWCETWAREALRVAKPAAYLLAFGGTRTVHRLACAIEDAGWIIRDTLVWAYAQGFPKSKASLKPAWEPIVMARKPGPLRELAIDACRIGMADDDPTRAWGEKYGGGRMNQHGEPYRTGMFGEGVGQVTGTVHPLGRWPANVILTDPIFDGGIEGVVGGGNQSGGGNPTRRNVGDDGRVTYENGWHGAETGLEPVDTAGTYSRFFLVPKADRGDREPVLNVLPLQRPPGWSSGEQSPGTFQSRPTPPRQNVHPTVKPTELMRHLVRLVTPSGGTVLDPFLGSGSTALAAETEGFAWIGIEKDAAYVAIVEARLNGTQRGLGLSA
jgi:DNA modification methylase